jgi:uncharacterized membrane protein
VSEETPQSGLTDNAAAGLAYVTIIPAIIFLVVAPYNQKSFVRFNAWQSIFLAIAFVPVWIVLAVIGFIPFVNLIDVALFPLVGIGFLIVWVICLVKAFNGQKFVLPLIGKFAEQQAGA